MSKSEKKLGLKSLKVKYHGIDVGMLALNNNGKVAFSYNKNWLIDGFSISPFSLPLEDKVFIPKNYIFGGLFGIFSDSLPDAWGKLLLERTLKKYGISNEITILDRLALVGQTGMGALEYEPDYNLIDVKVSDDLDYLSEECEKVFNTEYVDDIDMLYKLAGSSGGARPKILTDIDSKEWIIKFPSHFDSKDIGLEEFEYSLCAKKCGINMTETKLYSSKVCKGYFGIVRFDREYKNNQKKKIHMATVAAVLEADFNSPCLDYHTLMKLTKILTRDNTSELENMYRRMCFNVFAHNRDDHAKNFSFIYIEEEDMWHLSPAYDLTYSNTYYGEHTTSVDGNGRNPGEKEILNVGIQAGITKQRCIEIMEDIKQTVVLDLGKYIKTE